MGLIATQPNQPLRCAIYARVSPKPEGAVGDNYSIKAQLHEMKAFALKKYGCANPAEYIDKDKSGGTLLRADLERLRDHIALKLFDVVIAYSPDRWSRELVDTMILDKELKKGGARMDFVSGSYEATPEGEFARDAQALVAKYERAKFKERTRRCRRQKSRDGHPHSTTAADGWRYEGHKFGKRGEYVLVPERAKIMRDIFQWTADGMTNAAVQARLNDMRILTLKGHRWFAQSVAQILKKTAYYGEMAQNGELIRVPAIVTRDLWNRAHEALERNRLGRVGRPPREYLLSGLLWCARDGCGKRCRAHPNGAYPYYRCHNIDLTNHHKRRCHAPSVSVKVFEPLIWNAVWDGVCNPALLWQLVEAYYERVAGRPKAKDPAMVRLDRARRVVARAEEILKDPDSKLPYKEAQANLDAAQRQLAEAQMQVPAEVIAMPKRKDVETVSAEFRAMRGGLRDFDLRRAALCRLVEKILYADGNAEIHCHLPAANSENCNDRITRNCNLISSIPFIINVRVAA